MAGVLLRDKPLPPRDCNVARTAGVRALTEFSCTGVSASRLLSSSRAEAPVLGGCGSLIPIRLAVTHSEYSRHQIKQTSISLFIMILAHNIFHTRSHKTWHVEAELAMATGDT